MGETGGQHAGLARPGAGEDEERPVQGLHRDTLFGVQSGEIVAHAGADTAIRGRTPRIWAMADVNSGRFSV